MKLNPLPFHLLKAKIRFSIGITFFLMLGYFVYIQTNLDKQAFKKESEEEDKYEAIRARFEQEFEMMKDPKLNDVPTERLLAARSYTKQLLEEKGAIPGISWAERGPNNVGGRTRAILIDRRDATNNTVLVGSVSGGLWKTTNFLSTNPTWQAVDHFMGNLAISSLIQDPRNSNVMYAGTGEGWGNIDAVRGAGIWKSENGGTTWTQLSSTNNSNFYYVQDLAIGTNGALYAATWDGIKRSINGGSSWTTLYAGYRFDDLELGADGSVFASAYGGVVMSDAVTHGVNVGQPGNWKFISPTGYGDFYRIEIACAPSNKDRVYLLCQLEDSDDCTHIFRSNSKGSSWTSVTVPTIIDQGRNSNFTRGQAWYDLIAAVDPNNADKIYIGGVDALRSTDGGNTWKQISNWSQLFDPIAGFSVNQYLHADHHQIVFLPNSSAAAIWGTDGGIYYSSNLTTTGLPSFTAKNQGYNVTQFYACAMHPSAGSNYFLAGAQDNGTQQFTRVGLGATNEATGGDGAYCHIDQDNPNIQIASHIYSLYEISIDGGQNFKDVRISEDGWFINPTDYDDKNNKLYAAYEQGTFLRWDNPSDGGFGDILGKIISLDTSKVKDKITNIRVDPNTANRIWLGFKGGIVKVNNAHSTSPQFTYYNAPSEVASAWVSCITVDPKNNDRLLITYSSYGVKSIWEVTGANGSTLTWTSIEGNVPDMPVRWIEFNPHSNDQALIATEQGVWSTDNINGTSTDWRPTNDRLANVRVDMLQIRSADNTIAAATHGRGLFTATIPAPASTTCDTPAVSKITIGNITQTTAQLNTTVTNISQYQWRYRTVGGANWIESPATAAALNNLTTLQPGTTYEVQLKVKCANGVTSNWSASKTFTTLAAVCNAPTTNEISASNITQTTAELNSSISNANAYQWRYRKSGATTWTERSAAATALTNLSNLTANTTYEFQLRITCSNAAQSNWSASKTFKTEATPVCAAPTAGQTGILNPTYTSVTLVCLIGNASSYGWQYRKAGADTWIELANTQQNIFSISNLEPGNTYEFRVRVQCNTTWSDWSLVRTFSTPALPTCTTPNLDQITVSDITQTTATLTTTNTASKYQWRYREVETTDWVELDTMASASVNIADLVPNATYEVQLRITCTNGLQSNWSASKNFTTEPIPTDCEAPTDSEIGALNMTATSANLICLVTNVSNYGWRYRKVGATVWMDLANTQFNIQSILNLTPGMDYEFQVRVQCGSVWSSWSQSGIFKTENAEICLAPTFEQIIVSEITQTTVQLTTTVENVSQYQWRYRAENANDWTEFSWQTTPLKGLENLSANTSYEVQLRVICDSGSSDWSVSKIFTTLVAETVCEAPALEEVNASNPTTSSIRLICSITNANQYGWRYRKANTANWVELPSTSNNVYELINLEAATNYEFQIKIQCENTWSEWSPIRTFTTDSAPANVCSNPLFSKLLVNVIKPVSARLNYQVTGLAGYRWRHRLVGTETWTENGPTTTNYIFVYGLQSSSFYEYQVSFKCDATNWSAWSDAKPFTTGVVNDNPCDAIELQVDAFCPFSTFTTIGATPTTNPSSPSSCTAGTTSTLNDVWFKVQLPSTGNLSFWTAAGDIKDGVLAAYYGDNCSNIIEFGCQDEFTAKDDMPAVLISGPPDTWIYIRFWGKNGQTGTFKVCVHLEYESANVADKNTVMPNFSKINADNESKLSEVFFDELQLAPNPASNSLRLTYGLPEPANAQLFIYNNVGEKVKYYDLSNRQPGKNEEFLDVSDLKQGLYILELRGNGIFKRTKFTVIH